MVVGIVSLRKRSHFTRTPFSKSGACFCLLSIKYLWCTHVFCRSSFEEPSCDEGFEEIVKVNFIPRFKDEKIKELYMQFL